MSGISDCWFSRWLSNLVVTENLQSLAMGFYEISTGLGMIIGPLLGGWLYSIGGFGLPFYAVGGMMLFGAALNLFLVPTVSIHFKHRA